MAYGLKYELLAKSKKYKDLYKLRLSKADYVGAEIDRNVPMDPFMLRKDSAGIIRGTSLEFGIRAVTDFEFLEFYTTNKREILAEYYRGTTLLWKGYVLPEQYQEIYKPAPVTVWFTASDGLGLLKDVDFTLTGSNNQLDIILHCLSHLDLGLQVAVAITIHEENHNTAYCPLYQTYEDASFYENMKCYEVLKKVLQRYDASITQSRGRWLIMSSIDKKSDRIIYSSFGNYVTTEAAPAVLNLGVLGAAATDVHAIGSPPGAELEKAGSEITLSHEYGRRDSWFTNHLFEIFDWAELEFEGWTFAGASATGGHTPFQREYGEGKYYLYKAAYTGYLYSDNIYQAQTIENVSNQDFVFQIKIAGFGYTLGAGKLKDPITMNVEFRVQFSSGGTMWYLDKTTGWTTTAARITTSVISSTSFGQPEWNEVTIVTDELPAASGVLQVILYGHNGSLAGTGAEGVGFVDVRTYFLNGGEKYPAGTEYELTIDGTATGKLDDIDLFFTDAPNEPNNHLFYNKITKLSDGSITQGWTIDGLSGMSYLIVILARLIASRCRVPRYKIQGVFRGEGITFDTVIKHVYNSNKEFEILEMEHSAYHDKYTLTLLEALPYAETSFGLSASLEATTVDEEATAYDAGAAMSCDINIINNGSVPGGDTLEWQVVDLSDVVQSSGQLHSGIINVNQVIVFTLSGITAPASEGTYKIRARILGAASWVYSDAITVTIPVDLTIDSIGTIADGEENTVFSATVNYTNNGGSGNVMLQYGIWDSADQYVSGASVEKAVSTGSNSTSISLTYPSAGNGYVFKVRETLTTTYVVSNSFDTTTPPPPPYFNSLTVASGETFTISGTSGSYYVQSLSPKLSITFTPDNVSGGGGSLWAKVVGGATTYGVFEIPSCVDTQEKTATLTLNSTPPDGIALNVELWSTLPQ